MKHHRRSFGTPRDPKPDKEKRTTRTQYPCPECGSNDVDKLRLDWWWCRDCGKEYDPEMK